MLFFPLALSRPFSYMPLYYTVRLSCRLLNHARATAEYRSFSADTRDSIRFRGARRIYDFLHKSPAVLVSARLMQRCGEADGGSQAVVYIPQAIICEKIGKANHVADVILLGIFSF